MSFWSRFRKPKGDDARTSESPIPAAARPVAIPGPVQTEPPQDLLFLRAYAQTNAASESEALRSLKALRGSLFEAEALDCVMTRSVTSPDLQILAASIFEDRGDPDRAVAILRSSGHPTAWLMLADLCADRSEFEQALSHVERVLATRLDYPGAAERRERWLALLGRSSRKPVRTTGITTVIAKDDDGPYRLLREVGRGGSAAVYEAYDESLKRTVALKMYHSRESDQLFVESRLAAKFAGPNIVRVFDIDPAHGYVVYEWAYQMSLRERIKDANFGQIPASTWAIPLVYALARLHKAGYVHNDIKPGNILFRKDGTPLLADFGIARKQGEPAPSGSQGYVSPERACGRRSDPRDDLYGLGQTFEDVANQFEEARSALAPWIRICKGPDAGRPSHAGELCTRMLVEAP